MKKGKEGRIGITSATANAANPIVNPRPVTDCNILDQQKIFEEAQRQCKSIENGKNHLNAGSFILKNTARPSGIKPDTVQKILITDSDSSDLAKGANPQGKIKEVVAAFEYNKMRKGDSSGIVNAPKHNSPNIKDVRISPDTASKRDLLFEVDIGDGRFILRPGGQVKTGTGKYVAESLVEMAKKKGYGKTAVVDARLVTPDGLPRVASDAFTPGQARKIQESGIRLRGVKDLDRRGEKLLDNINMAGKDGFDPLKRKELQQLQTDIARAYEGKAIAGRVFSNAAMTFAGAAILSVVIQYSTNQGVDIKAVLQSGGQAAIYGGTGVLADGALYNTGINMGKTAQEAKAFAQQGVISGFCILAVTADAISEFEAYRDGETTLNDAIVGGHIKAAIDLLPIIAMPLGLLSIPMCVGAQIGGRLVCSKIRCREKELNMKIEFDFEKSRQVNEGIDRLESKLDKLLNIYQSSGLNYKQQLRLVE